MSNVERSPGRPANPDKVARRIRALVGKLALVYDHEEGRLEHGRYLVKHRGPIPYDSLYVEKTFTFEDGLARHALTLLDGEDYYYGVAVEQTAGEDRLCIYKDGCEQIISPDHADYQRDVKRVDSFSGWAGNRARAVRPDEETGRAQKALRQIGPYLSRRFDHILGVGHMHGAFDIRSDLFNQAELTRSAESRIITLTSGWRGDESSVHRETQSVVLDAEDSILGIAHQSQEGERIDIGSPIALGATKELSKRKHEPDYMILKRMYHAMVQLSETAGEIPDEL